MNNTDNQNIDWTDPVFGDIPEEHRDWYLKESGTYWNDTRKDWLVKGLDKVNVNRKNKKGELVSVVVMRAEKFQDDMIAAKDHIRENIGNKDYLVTNRNAFDLMRYGETMVKVDLHTEPKLKAISFTK